MPWDKWRYEVDEEKTKIYEPSIETFNFAGQEINIKESVDSYGGLIWPGVAISLKHMKRMGPIHSSYFSKK